MSCVSPTNFLQVKFYDETLEIKSQYRIVDSPELEEPNERHVHNFGDSSRANGGPGQHGISQPQEQRLIQTTQNIDRQQLSK